MKVRDVMTWNVVTISPDTPIMEARKIMEAHNIRRLPVVDRGKLVGMVSKERIIRTGPSPATSLSVWEINYLLAKMTVKEIMVKDVVTVHPDMPVEAAIALAQNKGVGALPVLEDHNLIGIATTNDFFYKILNPVLGIGKSGIRIIITNGTEPKNVQEIMEMVRKHGLKIISMHSMPPVEGKEHDLCLHLDTEDVSQLVKDLASKGFTTETVER
ncbi:MAG TPA: CBS domain-containing protein [Dehalococcoidia bacterium]|nr:CBS domain-containing protein [Dehalococcoidia bacterium]